MPTNTGRRPILKSVSRALSNRVDYTLIHGKPKKKFKGTILLGLIDTETLQNEKTSLGPQLSTGRK